MCSGGDSYDYEYAAKQARLSKIKSDQEARQGKINVVTGGEQGDYRRNTSKGAKDLGLSGTDIENKRLSDLFVGNQGQGAILTTKTKAERKAKEEEKKRRLADGVGGV